MCLSKYQSDIQSCNAGYELARIFKCTFRFILNLSHIQKYRHDGRYLTVNLFMRTNYIEYYNFNSI